MSSALTEASNPSSVKLSSMSIAEIAALMNREDGQVVLAVQKALPAVEALAEAVLAGMQAGGRLFYVGAGTSGRLGVLDASECPPTFGVSPDTVIGLIPGGEKAFIKAVEGAEDSRELGRTDLENIHLTGKDVVCGLAASGRTPYVLGAIAYAREIGALTLGISCSPGSEVDTQADIGMSPLPGPEAITGSTRMKSGTAQKMILNMLSTGVMVRLGKVYSNLMVDVQPSNEKLVRRCVRIVSQAARVEPEQAEEALKACDYHCKTAIVMIVRSCTRSEAEQLLAENDGLVAAAIGE